MHPEWSPAMIEDYLNIFENLFLLAGGVDDAVPGLPGAIEDNIPVFDSDGDLKDSGVAIDEVSLKVVGGTENNILILDADGDMKDSEDSISGIETRSTRRAFFFARNF